MGVEVGAGVFVEGTGVAVPLELSYVGEGVIVGGRSASTVSLIKSVAAGTNTGVEPV